MAKTATLNIRIDPETKEGVERLYSSFGITVSDAVSMFFRQSLLVGGLPFQLVRPERDSALIRAREAIEQIREKAEQDGTSKMTMEEIDAEIAEVRRESFTAEKHRKP